MIARSSVSWERIVFLVLFLVLCGVTVLAQRPSDISAGTSDTALGGGNSIYGTVILPSGQSVERRIRVRLVTETRGDRTATTDGDGNFFFRGLTTGRYSVVIDNEKEYEPVNVQVDIYQGRGAPPQQYPLSIRLALKGTAGQKPGVINADLATVPKSALEFYTKAAELAKAGNHKEAIENLQLAVAEYPEFMLAYNEMGVQYLRLNEAGKAEEAFRSALKIKAEAFEPLINLGIILEQTDRFSEAETTLRAALKQNEKSAVGHYFLGRSLAKLGRFDEAGKELIACVKLGGDEMKEAHRLLAIIYSAQGKKKQAAAELETYLRLVPEASDAEQLRLSIERLRGTESQSPANPATTKPSS
ncbi:MAG TPA: hypothetical protein DEA22_03845 [Blastocatellia bacterium]|nr:hypothetical protein [Blastocatellia bacterium]